MSKDRDNKPGFDPPPEGDPADLAAVTPAENKSGDAQTEKPATAPAREPDAPPPDTNRAQAAGRGKGPIGWAVSLDGNPEVIVPTPAQKARKIAVPRSESEAWALYAEHLGIRSTVHQFSASPVFAE